MHGGIEQQICRQQMRFVFSFHFVSFRTLSSGSRIFSVFATQHNQSELTVFCSLHPELDPLAVAWSREEKRYSFRKWLISKAFQTSHKLIVASFQKQMWRTCVGFFSSFVLSCDESKWHVTRRDCRCANSKRGMEQSLLNLYLLTLSPINVIM